MGFGGEGSGSRGINASSSHAGRRGICFDWCHRFELFSALKAAPTGSVHGRVEDPARTRGFLRSDANLSGSTVVEGERGETLVISLGGELHQC